MCFNLGGAIFFFHDLYAPEHGSSTGSLWAAVLWSLFLGQDHYGAFQVF